MNKYEYWKSSKQRSTPEYRYTHELLKQWQIKNNITDKCVIHHRDDTEECRKYNEAHYEHGGQIKWGAFRKALKTGGITFETRPASVFIDGGK